MRYPKSQEQMDVEDWIAVWAVVIFLGLFKLAVMGATGVML